MKKYLFLFIAFWFFVFPSICQFSTNSIAQPQMNSSEILHAMQNLNTLGTVLYIAAHPDDENTRLLSWLVNEKHVRTIYLSMTRGDGGQNLIGSEKGDMLGAIRTEELLAARKIDGAEQWFTRAVDFGYSKTPEETFRFWNKNDILYDVVLAIRMFKPDVIITRFPTTGEGGHGHHTASAILALEAFDLAADSTVYPDQLKLFPVWKAKRVLWNTFNFGTTNTTSEKQVKIDIGTFNPLLGKSYTEIAAASRTMHKSQGFGSSAQRGSQIEYFKFLKGDSCTNDIFEGVNLNWNRLGEFKSIESKILKMQTAYNPSNPSASLKALKEIQLAIKTVAVTSSFVIHWKQRKLDEINKIVLSCAGVWMESTINDNSIVEGNSYEFASRILCNSNANVTLKRVFIDNIGSVDTTIESRLTKDKLFVFKRKALVSDLHFYNSPYWLGKFDSRITSGIDINGRPVNREAFIAYVSFNIEGMEIQYSLPLVYKITDPIKGELIRPIEVLPPVTVTPLVKVLAVNTGFTTKTSFIIKANRANFKGRFVLEGVANCKINYKDTLIDLIKKGDEQRIEVELTACDSLSNGFIRASVIEDRNIWNLGIDRIEYDHIPYRFRLFESIIPVVNVNAKLAGKKIGYINGAGDEVAQSLRHIGYTVTVLDDNMLQTAKLEEYDAIVTGVRAFNTNENLLKFQKRLLDYVAAGGRLIVQYNTNSRVGPVQSGIGPYKFTISRNRVTDEKSPVEFKKDSLGLLSYPNRITERDFDNWVQERGIYFATELDASYKTVLGFKDEGEDMQFGSLIYSSYGKGYFIYTGLSFFRELPAGVPGAYKLFINLLSIQSPISK